MLRLFSSTMVISIDHQSTTNDRLKPVLTTGLVNTHIDRSIANPGRLSTMLKHLLRNRLADQSQILCGASLGRGNEILFAASGSHDQDGRHAHIW